MRSLEFKFCFGARENKILRLLKNSKKTSKKSFVFNARKITKAESKKYLMSDIQITIHKYRDILINLRYQTELFLAAFIFCLFQYKSCTLSDSKNIKNEKYEGIVLTSIWRHFKIQGILEYVQTRYRWSNYITWIGSRITLK